MRTVVTVVAWAALFTLPALAGSTARATALDVSTEAPAACHAGAADEERLDFERAVVDYDACRQAAPDSAEAARAGVRLEWLEARSEGGFGPLVHLERVRRDPAENADPSALTALAAAARTFPPGPVRVEARMLVAEAWLTRMHRTDDAIALLRAVVADPIADEATARFAEQQIVEALLAGGRTVEARAEAHAHAGRLTRAALGHVDRVARRGGWRAAAVADLVAFAFLASSALVRAARSGRLAGAWRGVRRLAGPATIFAADVGLLGALLASADDAASARPFLAMGAATLAPVLTARAWSAVGATTARARAGRAVLCAASTLAGAFLVLDRMNPAFLEGFGL